MFATLVINALFMATASAVMFAVRSDTGWRRGLPVRVAPADRSAD
jgi:hypothetical protein